MTLLITCILFPLLCVRGSLGIAWTSGSVHTSLWALIASVVAAITDESKGHITWFLGLELLSAAEDAGECAKSNSESKGDQIFDVV